MPGDKLRKEEKKEKRMAAAGISLSRWLQTAPQQLGSTRHSGKSGFKGRWATGHSLQHFSVLGLLRVRERLLFKMGGGGISSCYLSEEPSLGAKAPCVTGSIPPITSLEAGYRQPPELHTARRRGAAAQEAGLQDAGLDSPPSKVLT